MNKEMERLEGEKQQSTNNITEKIVRNVKDRDFVELKTSVNISLSLKFPQFN
jgi:hypothetical protein